MIVFYYGAGAQTKIRGVVFIVFYVCRGNTHFRGGVMFILVGASQRQGARILVKVLRGGSEKA